MKFLSALKDNQKAISEMTNAFDLVFFSFKIGKATGAVCYLDTVCNKDLLGDRILRPLAGLKTRPTPDRICRAISFPSAKVAATVEDGVDGLLTGNALIMVEGGGFGVLVDLFACATRAITEPPTSSVVKGPREGFTENVRINLGLLRRRIKAKSLTVKSLTVGKYSKTEVLVVYVGDIADSKVAKDVIDRIKAINIDGVPDSSYVAKMIVEHKRSIIKQVGNTEKPDVLMAKLLEGRIGILVDGSPIAITVPYLLIEDFQSSEDYFQNTYRSNMQRVIRLTSITVAILLPSLFVAAQLFHLQVIPLNFLLTIVNSIKGIPLSPSFEMLFTLLIFEILNEASVRMPKYVGMALSIVGALVLGDTAVRAGIVSTPTIMIMALSGISLYTVPELVDSMSFLRLVYLVVAGCLGGYGLILLTCLLLVYLTSLENFDVPVLAPFAPLKKGDLKDTVLMTYLQDMKKRPVSLKSKNRVRLTNDRS